MRKILYITLLLITYQSNLLAQNKTVNLYVFVGKKISLNSIPCKSSDFDSAYKAKYQIIEEVYGHYVIDTIEFRAYDHYGTPNFSRYEYALLYLSQDKEGNWYHQKYIYDRVYLTKEKKWAGPINSYDYDHLNNTREKPPLVNLNFGNEVSFTLPTKKINPGMTEDEINELIDQYYPKDQYELKDGKAYLRKGYYINELFELKKNGVLNARGIF